MNQSDLLSRRRPIIRWGQSNIAGGYEEAAVWPERLRCAQDPIHCYNLACYHPASPDPLTYYARNDTWHRISPWQMGSSSGPTPVGGPLVGSWGLDLADGLLGRGVNAALIDYCIGGTVLNYWTPGASGSGYATAIEWTQARLAELEEPLDPLLVFYQGESGTLGGPDWDEGFADVAAGVRADLSVPNLGIVVVQIPATYTPGAAVAALQAAYVATDSHSRLAFCHDTTFVTTSPPNLHIDQGSGRRLAIGPDRGTTVKSVLSCILELLS